ncbi:DUF3427 domain-containing protein [Microlunatus sp. GCM10028923]|uniref:DUF3427 domain-containing protein n=1 Tax=Microlunatus sp. GCM10028923 TaxID=3273400 RepID=UPI00361B6A3A
MRPDLNWASQFRVAVDYGYLEAEGREPPQYHPKLVINENELSMLHALRAELVRSSEFLFSVAFVSPRAIALLKQELVEFKGSGSIVTSDYLSFNSPAAFLELLALRKVGIDVRLHRSDKFHPKGYIFKDGRAVTALVGSSNLTENALARNHEWNLRVTAAPASDLAHQFDHLMRAQLEDSEPLTQEWIDAYSDTYSPPPSRQGRGSNSVITLDLPGQITANAMQESALAALAQVREANEQRAIIISATGTGKTILSALDVRAFNPRRLLFVVHREQILDKTIEEYQLVLGGIPTEYGKLTGGAKQSSCRYVFATVQTLSRPDVLSSFDPEDFEYVIIDEAHRSAAPTYRRVLDHFRPAFLLGMTATPERTDSLNVYELFDYNVPYEIRLGEALEADMLAPFHYYGITDIAAQDGTILDADTDLTQLTSSERVQHLLRTIDTYGQAAVRPRGLIFCSRKDEARALSAALNELDLHGQRLRTAAVTGDDSTEQRNSVVRSLERGDLNYILTVDVFNEGVDIPTVNQVIMLRQTQSTTVFVQQLGRGLRKAAGKDYLVVIDFIGNYANNFMIPMALFGDESLNKESLRQKLISAEEIGVLPNLSSVRFDQVAQERVLRSIASTKLDSLPRLKSALETMRNRVGRIPSLWDFLRFEATDPVLLATRRRHFPELVQALLKEPTGLTVYEDKLLYALSHEIFTAKRPHELALLSQLLDGATTVEAAIDRLESEGISTTPSQIESAIDSLTFAKHAEADRAKFVPLAVRRSNGSIQLVDPFRVRYLTSDAFASAVDDLIRTGRQLVSSRYGLRGLFAPGRQYTRKETARILGWPRSFAATIYGYKVDAKTGVCPIFVTLQKSEDISATTAYEDALLGASTMRWFSRSKRTLRSAEVRAVVSGEVDLHVFVKKNDSEGSDYYYLGQATPADPEETTMKDSEVSIVRMLLHFETPIDAAMVDYFRPEITG